MHRIAKESDDPIRAQAAGFFFVGIAALAMQHLLVAHCHAAATNPIISIA